MIKKNDINDFQSFFFNRYREKISKKREKMEANNPTSLRLFPFFLHSFLSLSLLSSSSPLPPFSFHFPTPTCRLSLLIHMQLLVKLRPEGTQQKSRRGTGWGEDSAKQGHQETASEGRNSHRKDRVFWVPCAGGGGEGACAPLALSPRWKVPSLENISRWWQALIALVFLSLMVTYFPGERLPLLTRPSRRPVLTRSLAENNEKKEKNRIREIRRGNKKRRNE